MENHAIERLNALLAAGYEIEPSRNDGDAVSLAYPSRTLEYWYAIVYASGQVVFPISAGAEVRFYSDSPQEEFRAFVRSIPKPSWLKAHVRIRGVVAAGGSSLAVCSIAGWLLK